MLFPVATPLDDFQTPVGHVALHLTDIRQFDLTQLPNEIRYDSTWFPIDADRLAVGVTDHGGSAWIVDLRKHILDNIVQGSTLVDVSPAGDELLLASTLDDGFDTYTIADLYGEPIDVMGVKGPSSAAFVGEGAVAIATTAGIGVWRDKTFELKPIALDHFGTFGLTAAGDGVVVESKQLELSTNAALVDPATATERGDEWLAAGAAAPNPAGTKFATVVRTSGSFFNIAGYNLEIRSAATGDVVAPHVAYADQDGGHMARIGAEAWLTDHVLLGKFQQFSLDVPVGWSRLGRSFVSTTDDPVTGPVPPSLSDLTLHLVRRGNVLLAVNDAKLLVMTVSER